jgi:glutathione S-transferase
MDWQFSYATALFGAFYNLVRREPADRDREAIAQSAEKAGRMMATLNAALTEQPWLSGQRFGLGDIPMGVFTHSWFTLDIPRPEYPRVAEWYERLKTRPAYAQHIMIPLT